MNRSLADDLRSRTDPQLRDLLLARPDLTGPPPADLASLAGRAATSASVRRAVEHLDAGCLRVLSALVGVGAARHPVSEADVDAALGVDGRAQVQRLLGLALLWQSGDGLHVVRSVPDVLGGRPAGGPGHRLRLDEMPVDPPVLDLDQPGQPVIDAAAGARARETVRHVEELGEAWGAAPPRVLRAGGLSVRDLGRTAAVLDVTVEQAAWVLEVTRAADLLADNHERSPSFVLTTEFDSWAALGTAARWAWLAKAWLVTFQAPHLVGTRIGRGGSVNALSVDTQWLPIRAARALVLGELAGLAAGTGFSEASLLERLRWRRPLSDPDGLVTTARAVVREAGWLGVLARGGLSQAGRALAAGQDEADLAPVVEAMLAAPVDHILLQADLTAVVPGPVEGALAGFLRVASDVESRGGATVVRFTPTSLRRALDAGLTADEVLEQLREYSRGPVPQPLEYLVRDVGRRHGQTRVGNATAYLRSDDEATLATILADRSLAPAMLRRIAPTVLVSRAAVSDLLDLLREAGYAPVREAVDGSVVVTTPPRRRVRRQRRRDPYADPASVQRQASSIVGALRAAPAPDRPLAGVPVDADPAITAATLREALELGVAVWIGYADDNGRTVRHLVHVAGLEGGRVTVVDASGQPTVLRLHRITGATLDSGRLPNGR